MPEETLTFENALVNALLKTAQAPLTEGDQRIMHEHLNRAMWKVNSYLERMYDPETKTTANKDQ